MSLIRRLLLATKVWQKKPLPVMAVLAALVIASSALACGSDSSPLPSNAAPAGAASALSENVEGAKSVGNATAPSASEIQSPAEPESVQPLQTGEGATADAVSPVSRAQDGVPVSTRAAGLNSSTATGSPASSDEEEPEPTEASGVASSSLVEESLVAEGPLAANPVGIESWINSDPLSLEELRGRVVLVDFWTYTCVNCIRTFPYLKLWHSRYADDGLVILGIHTPEFEFEKFHDNVLEATRQNGIAWPVALDNDYQTWRAYNNRYWPAKYLIDGNGIIRYTHFGEGAYAETEMEIRKLLTEAGADLSDDRALPQDQTLDPTYLNSLSAEVTPELYAGYHRNFTSLMSGMHPYVVQEVYYDSAEEMGNFAAPPELEPHFIYFHGPWLVARESAQHGRRSHNYEDYLAVRYSAKSVNAVLTSDSGEPYRVRVTLDGDYLTENNAGADIQFGSDGESFLLVEQPRLYEVIDSPGYTQRQELRMSSNSPNFGLFAFTFGVYAEGP